ncbi:hypothetical protein NHX12_008478 [Muraenolepis orangiensis]|uniref:Notch ligand N-terminal domain-containing protein n=1 Tax=Muraenolepis orangiensis TaxID=630683 RepID=A0A9Q0DLF0_9TELE|nr:hypothetical protein NHX12_008478 [Muraenolepis orangiensis]
MEREGAHGPTPRSARRGQPPPRLRWSIVLLFALSVQPQAVCAVGIFELQIRHFQNTQGLLQTGECCDLQASGGQQHCSVRDPCDTFFRACLKEYQSRVIPVGTCTFGSGSTGVLGGNSQTLRYHGHEGGGGGGGGGGGLDGTNGHIVIPFKYAWPVLVSIQESRYQEARGVHSRCVVRYDSQHRSSQSRAKRSHYFAGFHVN